MSAEGMAPVSAYTARCYREGKWWTIDVAEEGRPMRAATQSRRLDQVDYYVRDLVRLFGDPDYATAEISVSVDYPDSLAADVAAANALREAAVNAQQAASERSRQVARDLTAAGLSVRDVGSALGVSFQRVSQLLDRRKTPVN